MIFFFFFSASILAYTFQYGEALRSWASYVYIHEEIKLHQMRYINESPLPFHTAATCPPCHLFTPSRRHPSHPPASSNHFSIAGPSSFVLAHSSTSHHDLHSRSPSPSRSFLFGLSIPAHQNTLCSPPASLSPHLRHQSSPSPMWLLQLPMSPLPVWSLVYAVQARLPHPSGSPSPYALLNLDLFLVLRT